jgi:4-amino-4-deoxy-L-arabinose transferase-like glycosyltransferase
MILNKIISKINIKVILIGIIALGFVLRFYQLDKFPVGFHIDEANLGYNGYSLLKTGMDDSGHRFPLYINMFDDNNPTGYHYMTILPIAIFGLTEFAVRFPAALFGGFSVLVFFALLYYLFLDKKVALLGAFLLAISPWHVGISRGSAETLVALFFVMLGFAGIIHGLRFKRRLSIVLGAMSLIASFFIYPTPRVFVPLLFFGILALFLRSLLKYEKKFALYVVGAFVGVCLASFLLVFTVKGGTGRFSQVSIFNYPETKLVLTEQIAEEGRIIKSRIITRLFHNKVINYTQTFVRNYFEYFTGEFLFIGGGYPQLVRIPAMGGLYLVELPFILLGALGLFLKKDPSSKIPFLWILFAPIVAALTVDDIPNLRRALVLMPMFELLAAYGFFYLLTLWPTLSRKFFLGIIGIFLFYNFLYFLNQYFIQAQSHRTWYRNNGFDTMVKFTQDHYSQYDHIIVTKDAGGMYPLILFFSKYDPALYQAEGSPRNPDFGGFGKYFFVPAACPSEHPDNKFPKTGKILVVNNGSCPDYNNIIFHDIYRQDGTKAFRLQL